MEGMFLNRDKNRLSPALDVGLCLKPRCLRILVSCSGVFSGNLNTALIWCDERAQQKRETVHMPVRLHVISRLWTFNMIRGEEGMKNLLQTVEMMFIERNWTQARETNLHHTEETQNMASVSPQGSPHDASRALYLWMTYGHTRRRPQGKPTTVWGEFIILQGMNFVLPEWPWEHCVGPDLLSTWPQKRWRKLERWRLVAAKDSEKVSKYTYWSWQLPHLH